MAEKKYTQKDNSGVLFDNDKKGNEKAPTYKGNCTIKGQKMYISAWLNESSSGNKYISLKFEEPKETKEEDAPF